MYLWKADEIQVPWTKSWVLVVPPRKACLMPECLRVWRVTLGWFGEPKKGAPRLEVPLVD